MNSKTYLTIAYKRNYVLQKSMEEQYGALVGLNRNTKQIHSFDINKTRSFVCK